jgi:hypothetical protein
VEGGSGRNRRGRRACGGHELLRQGSVLNPE